MRRLHLRPEEWLELIGIVVALLGLVLDFYNPGIPNPGQVKLLAAILGGALFLGGVTASLIRLRQFVERYEGVAAVAEGAVKYGGAVGLIAEAIGRMEQSERVIPHVRAGGKALERYALDILPSRARELRELSPGRHMTLVEYHYINDFLFHLVESLPAGSTWFGVTHLTEGWLERSAEPGYRRVVTRIQERCRRNELAVLRIYCVRGTERDRLQSHLDQEAQSGITVRVLGRDVQLPPDLTLIWPPGVPLRDLRQTANPDAVFGDLGIEPECGLEFGTAAGRLIRQLVVYSRGANQVNALRQHFTDAWQVAAPP